MSARDAGSSSHAPKPPPLDVGDVLGALCEISTAVPGGGPALLEDMLRSVARRTVRRMLGAVNFEDHHDALLHWLELEGAPAGEVLKTGNGRLRLTVEEPECPFHGPCRDLRAQGDHFVCAAKIFCEQALWHATARPARGILLCVKENDRCVFELFAVSAEMLSHADRAKRNAAAVSHRYRLVRSRLSHLQTRYKAMLEATADAILVLDDSRDVLYVNPRACGVFAVREEDATGAKFTRGSVFGRIGDLCLDAVEALGGWEGETTIENRDGARVHNIYRLRFSPFECPDSHEQNILVVLEDVTREELLRRAVAEQAERLEIAVNEKTRELRRANARLRALAQTDPLTGLANRRMFQEILHKELKRAERTGDNVGVILADIDGFKSVNDLCGHQAGDEVLQKIAEILLKSVRESDTVARWGGDEFIILLPCAGASECARVGGRIQEKLQRAKGRLLPGDGPEIGLSIGWSSTTRPDAEALVAAADRMMYNRKKRKARAARGSD